MSEYVTCPHCKNEVPSSKVCIYCGAELTITPKAPEVTPVTTVVAQPRAVAAQPRAQPRGGTAELAEVEALMSGIANHYRWKTRLVEVLRSGEITKSTFDMLYDEYSSKLNEFSARRRELLDNLRSRKDEREGELSGLDKRLDELRVKPTPGQRSAQEREAEKLKMSREGLERELLATKERLDILDTIFGYTDPNELRSIEEEAKRNRDSLATLVAGGEIAEEEAEKIGADLDQVIALLGQVLGGRRETEETLREELEIVRARYAVGEVTLTEYEKRKQEIEQKLKEIW